MRTIAVAAETTVPSDEALLALREIGPYEPSNGGMMSEEPGILDTDGALETVNLVGLQILQNAEMALLAQANLDLDLVLRLLDED